MVKRRPKKKNPHAQAMARSRWAKATKKDRLEQARRMVEGRQKRREEARKK